MLEQHLASSHPHLTVFLHVWWPFRFSENFYSVPGQVWPYAFFTSLLCCRYYHYPHVTDEETEAQGSEIPHQDPKACKSPWDSHMSNSKTHLLNPLLCCWEDPLEKEMATHSSTLAWKIPWMEEPGKLQPMELQRVAVLSPFQDVHPQHRLLWPLFSSSLARNSDFSPKGGNLFLFLFFVSKAIKSPSFGVFYSTLYVVFSSSF